MQDPASLWHDYHESRSNSSRDALVTFYTPWVRRVVKHTVLRSVPGASEYLDDFQQDAAIALLGLLERYEPQSDARFTTFAAARIRGSVIDSARELGIVHLPRSAVKKAREDATASLPRVVAFSVLDAALRDSDDPFDAVDNRDYVDAGLIRDEFWSEHCRGLPDNDRAVLLGYYRDDRMMREIGDSLGVCESRVSQINHQLILRLKTDPPSLRKAIRRPRMPANAPSRRIVTPREPDDGVFETCSLGAVASFMPDRYRNASTIRRQLADHIAARDRHAAEVEILTAILKAIHEQEKENVTSSSRQKRAAYNTLQPAIIDHLTDCGPSRARDIAAAVGHKADSVRATLSAMKRDGLVTTSRMLWSLAPQKG